MDSNIWLGHLLETTPHVRTIIESHLHYLYCSVLSIHEIAVILHRNGFSEQNIGKALDFIRQNATVIDVTEKTAITAAHQRNQNKLPTVDSLIYASAIQEGALLITLDRHFQGLENTQVIAAD